MTRPASALVAADARAPDEDPLARFFDHSRDVLAIIDGRGRILLISPSVERVLGHPAGGLIGRRFLRWVHREDRRRLAARTRTLHSGHPLADLDARIRHAGGGWVPMSWSLSAGPAGRVYAVGRDRTDAARRQEALLGHRMAELRLRTAMELHDGILQTLTAAGLQIAVARQLVRSDPATAEQVLDAVGDSVVAEQREIRLYVDEIKDGGPARLDGSLDLAGRLRAIIRRVGMIWGVATSVDIRIADRVPAELGRQILRVAQEATVNAVRHGTARAISVTVTRDDRHITITVADDGGGFPFLGEYDHEALAEKRLGPVSLKHRVARAGGRIAITSTRQGATVTVRLPVPHPEEE